MGWFAVSAAGGSYPDDTISLTGGGDLMWGDGPADLLDTAIEAIIAEFEAHDERPPTKAEIRAGLEFALGGYDETPEGYIYEPKT